MSPLRYPSLDDLVYLNTRLGPLSIKDRIFINGLFKNVSDFVPIRRYYEDYKNIFLNGHNNELLKEYINAYKVLPDCNVFHNYSSGNSLLSAGNRLLSVCTNGDGRVWYNKLPEGNHILDLTVLGINDLSINLLNSFMFDLRQENITPIILLEIGNYNTDFKFNTDRFIKKLNIKKDYIVDTVNMNFPDEKWADTTHINIKAVEEYSTHILNSIEHIVK